MKRLANSLVGQFYGIYSREQPSERDSEREEREREKQEKRVEILLGPESPFLQDEARVRDGPPFYSSKHFLMHRVSPQKDDIKYTNPSIVSLVVEFLFPTSRMPMEPKYLDSFNPMPLPIIALACTAVSGLRSAVVRTN